VFGTRLTIKPELNHLETSLILMRHWTRYHYWQEVEQLFLSNKESQPQPQQKGNVIPEGNFLLAKFELGGSFCRSFQGECHCFEVTPNLELFFIFESFSRAKYKILLQNHFSFEGFYIKFLEKALS
jgi:hypothetical protein